VLTGNRIPVPANGRDTEGELYITNTGESTTATKEGQHHTPTTKRPKRQQPSGPRIDDGQQRRTETEGKLSQ
jgi:hypothetical protein